LGRSEGAAATASDDALKIVMRGTDKEDKDGSVSPDQFWQHLLPN
jgi:hypothetical protein